MGRKGWRKLCPGPAYFIVSRETGKLSYHWKHVYGVAECGPDKGAVVNPDTGTTIPSQDGGPPASAPSTPPSGDEVRYPMGSAIGSAAEQISENSFSANGFGSE